MRGLATLSLVLLLAACDTTGIDPVSSTPDPTLGSDPIDLSTLSQDAKALIGVWEWMESVSYFTASGEPVRVTPESTGRTVRWMFSETGRAYYYENGELVRETTYEVRQRSYGNGQTDALPSIQFGDDGYGLDFGIEGDMLVLDSRPVDGPQSRFKRK